MSALFISRIHFPVTTLGPGRRIGIWFQGCSIRCEGCISADTWRQGKFRTSVSEVIRQVKEWVGRADGVTITGGEPFDQPEALVELIRGLRKEISGTCLVYSGYRKEQIQITLDKVDGYIDALVSEPFELTAPDTMPLRGSDNQQLHLLTQAGRENFACYEYPAEEKAFDAMFDEDGTVWFCGIPKRNDLERVIKIMEFGGSKVVFTAAKSSKGT